MQVRNDMENPTFFLFFFSVSDFKVVAKQAIKN